MKTLNCLECKKEFSFTRNINRKFCSLSCYHKNMIGKPQSHPNAKGRKVWNKGLKLPQLSNINHPRYIRDRSQLAVKKNGEEYRNSPASRDWSRAVKVRDSWVCQIKDEQCSGRLETHHILSWKEYPQLRYDINNGITLCHAHHPRTRAEEKRLAPMFQDIVSVSVSK